MSRSAERSTLEASRTSARPIAVAPANPQAWAPGPRNNSDAALRALAESGGMLGVSRHRHQRRGKSDGTREDFRAMIGRTAEMTGPGRLGIGPDLCQDRRSHTGAPKARRYESFVNGTVATRAACDRVV